MKTVSKKLPATFNLPVVWSDENWAKPLVQQLPQPRQRLFATMFPGAGRPCRSSNGRRGYRGFTLIELLVVISIIAILAALLVPALAGAKKRAKIMVAKTDMNNIAAAISAYQSAYTLAPVPNPLPGNADRSQDFSFSETNSDVVVILMDVTLMANVNHVRNPQKHAFLSAKTHPGTTAQGVSVPDYNFRDPWGNPYVIAFDLDYDNKVDVAGGDPVYSVYPYVGIPKPAMVWSMGPDGAAENGIAGPNRGREPKNQDNIKSWE